MSIEDSDAALRIVDAGRVRVLARTREAFDQQAEAHPSFAAVEPGALDRLVQEAADRAGTSLWRISLAEGAALEYGIEVSDALAHPTVATAERLIDAPAQPGIVPPPAQDDAPSASAPQPEPTASEPAPPPEPTPAPEPELAPPPDPAPTPEPPLAAAAPPPVEDAVRVAAVHVSGIETLEPGDEDLELRLSDDGLDVIRRASGVAIGRLNWAEITTITVDVGRRRLRGRGPQTLEVQTSRGRATFELPGLTVEDAAAHLQPLLNRLRDSGTIGG